MSRGLNKIMLIGNLGRDPEMRFTPSGKPVTDFSLAVSRSRRTPEGEFTDETEWFRIVCWDRLAEIADQYLTKGTKVYVDGRVTIRRYTGNDGTERTSVDVIANEMIILTPRGERAAGGSREPSARGQGQPDNETLDEDFDDVPF
jgi:single-strand DNA-binding protein